MTDVMEKTNNMAVEMKMGSVHRLPPVKRAWKTFKYRRVTPDKKKDHLAYFVWNQI